MRASACLLRMFLPAPDAQRLKIEMLESPKSRPNYPANAANCKGKMIGQLLRCDAPVTRVSRKRCQELFSDLGKKAPANKSCGEEMEEVYAARAAIRAARYAGHLLRTSASSLRV